MIKIIVTYTAKATMRRAFYNKLEAENIGEVSRNEEGNLKYAYYEALEDPDKIVLLEIWKDEECLNKHKAAAHFAKIQGIKEEYILDTEVDVFHC